MTLDALTSANRAVRKGRSSRAFTLIELLVVLFVIAVLIAILLPGMAKCRLAMRKTRELSTARQVLTAVMMYTNDAKGEVLPGYAKRQWVNGGMIVRNEAGDRLTGEVAQRYPWRIAPYLNFDFRGLYENSRVLADLREREAEYAGFGVNYDYVVSLFPALGMNANFFGGTERTGQFEPAFQRVFGRVHAVKLDALNRPSEVLMFASARAESQSAVPIVGTPEGFFRVDPPVFTRASGRLWQSAYEPRSPAPGLNSGFISLRYDGRAVTAHADGHAEVLTWDDLGDMRRWSDAADEPTWGIEPR